MAIDRFTKARFEAMLPVHKVTGQRLWECEGLVGGEYVYRITQERVDGSAVSIVVRSSIDASGVAASTGEDSIRLWLEARKANSTKWDAIGKAAGRWTTRVIGWESRLLEKLREMWKLMTTAKTCPVCKEWLRYGTSRQQNENNGRIFHTCRNCKAAGRKAIFEWVTEQDPKRAKKYSKAGD